MALVNLGDVSLSFTDEGNGPPMLFVHGWSCDRHDWKWQMPHFAKSHRVIAVDLRGHGQSSVPASGYDPKTFAADLDALLAYLDCGPVIAVGHSLGGLVVSTLAIEHPARVTAVVCVDPGYLFADEVSAAISSNLQALLADPQAFLNVVYAPDTPDALKAWHLDRLRQVPAHVLHQSLANLHQAAARSVAEPYLKRRTCPVLAIYAGDDRIGIDKALFTHPHSSAMAWPGVGHWLHQERPDDFNLAVDEWMSSLNLDGAC